MENETKEDINNCQSNDVSLNNLKRPCGSYRILLMISDTGGGHRASALALGDAFNCLYPNMFDIRIVDVWTDYGVWPFNTFVPAYKFLCTNPKYWKLLYDSTKSSISREFINNTGYMFCGAQFKKFLCNLNPDIICSIHPLCQDIPLKLLREMKEESLRVKPSMCLDIKKSSAINPNVKDKARSNRNHTIHHRNHQINSSTSYSSSKSLNDQCNNDVSTQHEIMASSKVENTVDIPVENDTNDSEKIKSSEKIADELSSRSENENSIVYSGKCLESTISNYNIVDISKVLKRRKSYIPFVTVVTDIGSAHPTWFSPDVDLCFVPSEEVQKLAFAEGLRKEQIRLYGVPIKKEFWQDAAVSKSELREKLGLDTNSKICLIVGGGDGVGNIENVTAGVVSAMLKSPSSTQYEIVIVCGKNFLLKKELERKFKRFLSSHDTSNNSNGQSTPMIENIMDQISKKPSQRIILKKYMKNSFNNAVDMHKEDKDLGYLKNKIKSTQSQCSDIYSLDFAKYLSYDDILFVTNRILLYKDDDIRELCITINKNSSDNSSFDSQMENNSKIPLKNPFYLKEFFIAKSTHQYNITPIKPRNRSTSCNSTLDATSHDDKNLIKRSISCPDLTHLHLQNTRNWNIECLNKYLNTQDKSDINYQNICIENPNNNMSISNIWKSWFNPIEMSSLPSFLSLNSNELKKIKSSNDSDSQLSEDTNWKWKLSNFSDIQKQLNNLFPISSMNKSSIVNDVVLDSNENTLQVKMYIESFVSNMDEWMGAADLIVTKAGPGTIAEACCRSLPIVLFFYLPGQEEGNVKFVIDSKCGFYSDSPDEIGSIAINLLNNENMLQQYSENAKKAINQQATCCIAKDIIDLMLQVI